MMALLWNRSKLKFYNIGPGVNIKKLFFFIIKAADK
jgi:hypothetical protein